MSWLDLYLDYTAEFESPASFHFWCGVSAIAACLNRNVWTRLGSEIFYPNHYIILISPSAIARKSTAMEKAVNLLRKAGGVNVLYDKATDSALWFIMSALTLEHGVSNLFIHVDELSTMFTNEDASAHLISSLTRMYMSPEHLEKTTKGEGRREVSMPCVNFLGGTTPTDLMVIFPGATTGMGFSGRCLFIYEPGPRHRNPLPELHMKAEQPLVMKLREYQKLKGEIPLDQTAVEYYKEWYEKMPALLTNDADSTFIARSHVHMMHLALVLAVSKGEATITRMTLIEAQKHLMHVQENLKLTIHLVGRSESLQDMETFIGMLAKCGGKADRGTLLRMNRLDAKRLSMAAEGLRQAERITWDVKASGKKPKTVYRFVREGEKE